ncbi:MAG TPA: sigma-70 family RNA polymerase sigma factor [Flavisolibacter sp.]|nr:sigma-70 family RNA polymerase sigma factor [Flavisolibacter sp.]
MPYNYSLYEDIDLVEMIRVDHDQMAFREIYMRYADPLFRLAFQKTNNKESAEDIVQITFVKLWAGRVNLKINYSLKAYLYTSAKNNVITHYLRQLSKTTISLDLIRDDLLPSDTTREHINHSETLALYNRSLEELPDKCREVFVLSRNGYSLKEIAQIQNISPKTAEVHISKALKYLRKRMNGNILLLLLGFFI